MWRIWAAALFWGLNWPVVKVLLTGASPWTLRAAGLASGGLLVALVAAASGQSLRIERTHWCRLVLAGLLNVAAFNILVVFAQLTLTASRAVIFTYTMPLWSVLFAWPILGERIDRVRGLALLLGVLGIAILCEPFWPLLLMGQAPEGVVYVLLAAILWAAGTVVVKRWPVRGAPLAVTTWQIAVGALAAAAGMALFETPRLDLWRPDMALAFAYHVLLAQAAAYAIWFSLVERVPASTAALGTLLVPVFGILGAVILIGERPSLLDLTAFAVILAAVVIDQGYRARRS